MAFFVGDTITQGFYTGAGGEGFTFTSRDPGGATFLDASNIIDLGDGDYLLTFTVGAKGNYYARFIGGTSGEVIKGNWDVDSPAAFAAAAVAGQNVSTTSIEWVEVIPS